MLHVTNGDCAARILERTSLGGDVLAWREVLHDGPVPHAERDELRRLRAAFIASAFGVEAVAVLADQRARDQRLERALEAGEPVVLWFEHDLFDQLLLLQVLDVVGDRPGVELIVVEAFLGAMTADDLERLWPGRAPLRPEQRECAARAWTAFCAGDLAGLGREADAEDDGGLPHLSAALARLLDDVPGDDGLSRTERQLLRAIDRGAQTAGDAFMAAAAEDEAPFLGDTSAFWRLAAMTRSPAPPVAVDGHPIAPPTPVGITAAGVAILSGGASYIRPPGRECWLGGARLG